MFCDIFDLFLTSDGKCVALEKTAICYVLYCSQTALRAEYH